MRPLTLPTPLIPPLRFSRRKLALVATVATAAAAGTATIAVVDDGDSGPVSSSSRPAPDVRYDGGPEGVPLLVGVE